MRFSKHLPFVFIVLSACLLYLPTLRTGFLTDDFLDCTHTIGAVPDAFTQGMAGGYRPLMVASWALDNALWGITGHMGWHLTNLIILALGAFLLFRVLMCFVDSNRAASAGLAFFVFSFPTAVAVGRVSWRTTLLTLIPMLLSLILAVMGAKRKSIKYLVLSAMLYLIALLFKETFIAAAPFIAAAGAFSAEKDRQRPTFLRILGFSVLALLVYAVMRYSAMGTDLNYSESGTYGFFMIKNLFSLNAIFWEPWLSKIPVRILVFLIPVFVYFCTNRWSLRILVLSGGFFLLLPVSNLSPRPDLAVAAAPAVALTVALAFQRYGSSRAFSSLFLVLLAGMFFNARDELRILRDASESLENETDRIAFILEDLPGDGPVFIDGIVEEYTGYGTFWPGEYSMALKCSGYSVNRMVTDTGRIWEQMNSFQGEGTLVFASVEPIRSYSVSASMYTELPDTTVSINGSVSAGDLSAYPSCSSTTEDGSLCLFNPLLTDSIICIEPMYLDGKWHFDLASESVWLTGEPGIVIMGSSQELVFNSRNIAQEYSEDLHR